ncbi:MAG TPA: ferric reductase [Chloroflexi bacterium]|nr:ferric reductase [Chloroflexota bacterium]
MGGKNSGNLWYLVLIGVAGLAAVVGLVAARPEGRPLDWGIRGTALLGYGAVFLAILSAAYMRPLVKFFGQSFVKIHHIFSLTGLVLVTLHPLGVAVNAASVSVFWPKFDSLTVFLELGGRPAWYLIVVASVVAALRRTVGKNWRTIHGLNYVAFWLGTAHAIMIGTDFQSALARIMSSAMALVVVGVLVQKRRRDLHRK